MLIHLQVEREPISTALRSYEYKPTPLINDVLAILRDQTYPYYVQPETLRSILEATSHLQEGAIRTKMVRGRSGDEVGDLSGYVTNLAGICSTPDETLRILDNLGFQQLQKIEKLNPDIQDEVFAALRGDHATMRAIIVLDECQNAVMRYLSDMRDRSQLARDIRDANQKALRELYANPDNLHSVWDNNVAWPDRHVLYDGTPRICYAGTTDHNGHVTFVNRYFFYPKISHIRLGEQYGHLSVGQILDQITPDYYKRQNDHLYTRDVRTPSGVIEQLGRVGDPLAQVIAEGINRDKELRARIMQQEAAASEAAEKIANYYRTH